MMTEPRIWSHITDGLPDHHPLAQEIVCCIRCGAAGHVPNECMNTWVETGRGTYCLGCFTAEVQKDGGCLDDDWAVPDLDDQTAAHAETA